MRLQLFNYYTNSGQLASKLWALPLIDMHWSVPYITGVLHKCWSENPCSFPAWQEGALRHWCKQEVQPWAEGHHKAYMPLEFSKYACKMSSQWVSPVCLPASDAIPASHWLNFVKNRACHGWLCRTSVAQAGAESKPANSQFTALITNSAPCYPVASLCTLLGVLPGQDGETASEGRNRQKWELCRVGHLLWVLTLTLGFYKIILEAFGMTSLAKLQKTEAKFYLFQKPTFCS